MKQTFDQTAVVTGAAGGLGRAISRALVDSGRKVVVVDRDAESLAAWAEELGSQAHAIKLDITDHASVDRLLDMIPNGFKPIDILVNNAGHDIGGVRVSTRDQPMTGPRSFKPISSA
jgi:3-hydroxy acid dehydrogenase/malonic semialdehyde reductase